MAATIEYRKLSIIDSLVGLKNERIISLIETLLKSETDFWNQLSDKQKIRIEHAISEIDAGKGLSHESVMQEFRQKYSA
jgi:hypothetical protein